MLLPVCGLDAWVLTVPWVDPSAAGDTEPNAWFVELTPNKFPDSLLVSMMLLVWLFIPNRVPGLLELLELPKTLPGVGELLNTVCELLGDTLVCPNKPDWLFDLFVSNNPLDFTSELLPLEEELLKLLKVPSLTIPNNPALGPVEGKETASCGLLLFLISSCWSKINQITPLFKKKHFLKRRQEKSNAVPEYHVKLYGVVGQNEILIKSFEPSFIRDYDYEGKKQRKLRINLH